MSLGQKARICHVQVLPILSGVQRAMLEIFDQLDRRDFDLQVICRAEGDLTKELTRRGISFHCIAAIDRKLHPGRDYRAYRELRRYFARQKFDLVHTHSSKPGIIGRLAARHAGVPRIVHQVHAFAFHEFSSPTKRAVYSRIERWASRYCDHLLFVNNEEREMVVRQGWMPSGNCSTVYNGVNLDLLDPRVRESRRADFRRRHKLSDSETVILFNGRLAYPKQPLMLAEIAARLHHLRPAEAWRMVVVGSGEDEAALKSRVNELKMSHRVALLGWHDDPTPSLAAADIALQTSLAEGLPLALIEALAAGLPAVASDAKGNREVVTAEVGFLCPPRDPQAYAERLAALLDSAAQRTQMGRAARHRAEQHFDTVKNNRQILALYEKLLGNAVRPRAFAHSVDATSRRRAA